MSNTHDYRNRIAQQTGSFTGAGFYIDLFRFIFIFFISVSGLNGAQNILFQVPDNGIRRRIFAVIQTKRSIAIFYFMQVMKKTCLPCLSLYDILNMNLIS